MALIEVFQHMLFVLRLSLTQINNVVSSENSLAGLTIAVACFIPSYVAYKRESTNILALLSSISFFAILLLGLQLLCNTNQQFKLKSVLRPPNISDIMKDLEQELVREAKLVQERGPEVIPQIEFEDIVQGKVRKEVLQEIKKRGVVVIRNTVPKERASKWYKEVQDYLQANPNHQGYPVNGKPQVRRIKHTTAIRVHSNSITHSMSLDL